MITLTTEQAQQIEESLDELYAELAADSHRDGPRCLMLTTAEKALDTVSAARAQEQAEQEPVAWAHWKSPDYAEDPAFLVTVTEKPTGWQTQSANWFPLYAAPVQQAEQEPVAVYLGHTASMGNVFRLEKQIPVGTKLYAAPVRTKDLTDDELREIMKQPFNQREYLEQFARAVIAADRKLNGVEK